ncbi:phosphatidate cytidylyltransferase [Schlegelella sp. S2-27]|uniref:Phosphatidate cytidylyltransferase n=1 Tax=Caldimonas mangrovi TaxID=2944811 RepID=A0ABT0YTR8_9BURK|nr:phosphatidate cytidylyltransferase [Caldimonas mangrovi]MCM5681794.1 phosphatidate cytidylyltransferase [Caldimonas mangrovi]
MSLPTQATLLFAGVGGVLVVATAIGWSLKRRVAAAGPHAAIDNLNARIHAWWVMVGVLAVAFWLGAWGVIGLFALLSAVALREYTRVSAMPPERIVQVLAYAVALPMQYLLIGIDWYGLYSIFIPVYAFLVLPITAALLGDGTRFLERAAKTQWGLMICVFCISHVPALMLLDIPGFEGRNLLLIAYLVLVVQASDVLQYVWGKLAGRHPVAPRLSPSKTVEGAVGGILSATALGAALHGVTPFTPAEAAALSFAVCLMGFLGGLVMSAIKRDAGAKDWGSLIEGHGGVLDRLDSVAFAAPVYFHLVRYWWTP